MQKQKGCHWHCSKRDPSPSKFKCSNTDVYQMFLEAEQNIMTPLCHLLVYAEGEYCDDDIENQSKPKKPSLLIANGIALEEDQELDKCIKVAIWPHCHP